MGIANIPNDGRHLPFILTSTSCRKHGADEGVPCYIVSPDSRNGNDLYGACGARIKRAGYTGKISEVSMSLSTPGGRNTRKR